MRNRQKGKEPKQTCLVLNFISEFLEFPTSISEFCELRSLSQGDQSIVILCMHEFQKKKKEKDGSDITNITYYWGQTNKLCCCFLSIFFFFKKERSPIWIYCFCNHFSEYEYWNVFLHQWLGALHQQYF